MQQGSAIPQLQSQGCASSANCIICFALFHLHCLILTHGFLWPWASPGLQVLPWSSLGGSVPSPHPQNPRGQQLQQLPQQIPRNLGISPGCN